MFTSEIIETTPSLVGEEMPLYTSDGFVLIYETDRKFGKYYLYMRLDDYQPDEDEFLDEVGPDSEKNFVLYFRDISDRNIWEIDLDWDEDEDMIYQIHDRILHHNRRWEAIHIQGADFAHKLGAIAGGRSTIDDVDMPLIRPVENGA